MRRQASRALSLLNRAQTSQQPSGALPATGSRCLASDAMRGTTVLCVRKDQQVLTKR